MAIEYARSVFNELRLKAGVFAIEKLARPAKLEIKDGANLLTAQEQDSRFGNYAESANHYYSVLERSSEPLDRLDALIGLSQQLINLGKLGDAKELLYDSDNYVTEDMTNNQLFYFYARVDEKLGWVADYDGDFKSEKTAFNRVRAHLKLMGESSLESRKLYLTATHFLGRAHFGLKEYDKALEYFNEHLQSHSLNKDEQGFGHGWLARCYLAKNEVNLAESEAATMKSLFEKHLEENDLERGTMAHYFNLSGVILLHKGKFEEARESFERSLEIRYTKERYKKGEAESLFGIAASYWAQKNIGGAFIYFKNGLLTYPLSIIKSSI